MTLLDQLAKLEAARAVSDDAALNLHLDRRINELRAAQPTTLDPQRPVALKELLPALQDLCRHDYVFIGNTPVYPAQIQAGLECMMTAIKGKAPLLIAQPQQGKTGAMLFAIYAFMLILKHLAMQGAGKVSFQIVYLTNIADNGIRRQTLDRILQSDMHGMIHVIHHSEVRRFSLEPAMHRLFIVDECHYALGRDKPFHRFMREYGVEYGKPTTEWKTEGSTWVISMSATPYAHAVQTLLQVDSYVPIVMPVMPNFYSLNQLVQSGRLRQVVPMVRRLDQKYVSTDSFAAYHDEFLKNCREEGAGYWVVRARGGHVAAIKHLLRQADKRMPILDFNCTTRNLDQLDNQLSTAPPRPSVIIIRGSLRAGKTLTTTRYIRIWTDSAGSKADAVVQVVGRCLGFSPDRHTAKFPIYCNMEEVELALRFYAHLDAIPAGNWSSRVSERETYRRHIVSKIDDIPEEIRNLTYWGRKAKVSGNNVQDLAAYVLNGHRPTGKAPIIVIDAPNPNFMTSWTALLKKHPKCVGCYVYYEAVSGGMVQADEHNLRPDSLFRDG